MYLTLTCNSARLILRKVIEQNMIKGQSCRSNITTKIFIQTRGENYFSILSRTHIAVSQY